jgi:hypothetical protein
MEIYNGKVNEVNLRYFKSTLILIDILVRQIEQNHLFQNNSIFIRVLKWKKNIPMLSTKSPLEK